MFVENVSKKMGFLIRCLKFARTELFALDSMSTDSNELPTRSAWSIPNHIAVIINDDDDSTLLHLIKLVQFH